MNLLGAAFALVALVLSSAPGAHAAAEKLRIATTGGYPPFNYTDDAGCQLRDRMWGQWRSLPSLPAPVPYDPDTATKSFC